MNAIKSNSARAKILYALCAADDEAPAIKVRGLETAPVYAIDSEGLRAIVSDTLSPRVRPERRNITAHQSVLHTLMEGVPHNFSLDEIGLAIAARPHVRSVHDLHLWAVSSRQVALSAHLVVEDLAQWEKILADVAATLHELGIDHLTLQPEPLLRQVRWADRSERKTQNRP